MLVFTTQTESMEVVIDYEYENLFIQGNTPTEVIAEINKFRLIPLNKKQEVEVREDIVNKMNDWIRDMMDSRKLAMFQRENEAIALL